MYPLFPFGYKAVQNQAFCKALFPMLVMFGISQLNSFITKLDIWIYSAKNELNPTYEVQHMGKRDFENVLIWTTSCFQTKRRLWLSFEHSIKNWNWNDLTCKVQENVSWAYNYPVLQTPVLKQEYRIAISNTYLLLSTLCCPDVARQKELATFLSGVAGAISRQCLIAAAVLGALYKPRREPGTCVLLLQSSSPFTPLTVLMHLFSIRGHLIAYTTRTLIESVFVIYLLNIEFDRYCRTLAFFA